MYILGCTNRAIMSGVSNLHHYSRTQTCTFFFFFCFLGDWALSCWELVLIHVLKEVWILVELADP